MLQLLPVASYRISPNTRRRSFRI